MYPNLDSLSNAYLQWMFDNQPEYVREFLDQDRIADLDQVLLKSAGPAWKFYDQRVKEGKSHGEALDLALEALIPKDGPEFSENPPEPLSLDDQEKRTEAGNLGSVRRVAEKTSPQGVKPCFSVPQSSPRATNL